MTPTIRSRLAVDGIRTQRCVAVLSDGELTGLPNQPDATDVQESVDRQRPVADDELQELREVVDASRAGVHPRGHSGPPGDRCRPDAPETATREQVRVDVDEPWDDKAAAGVDGRPGRSWQWPFCDHRDPLADHADVEVAICLRRGIDHATAGDDQIELVGCHGSQ